MTQKKRHPRQLLLWLALGLACIGVAMLAVWQLAPCEYQGMAKAQDSMEIPVTFDEFRTIMIRNNPTRTIIEHGGMQLVNEEVLDLKLDLSRDRRPLINALLRRSQSEVTSKKRMVVAVNNEDVRATNLDLMQDAEITPQAMDVSTVSTSPAGDLKSYRTSLHAEPNGSSTTIHVTTEIELVKQLCKLFHGTANSRLEASTKDAVTQQLAALEQFALDNAH